MDKIQASLNPDELKIFKRVYKELIERTDQMFIWLLWFQWALAIVIAFTVTPLTWAGEVSSTHPHVYLAIFFGGALTLFPIFLLKKFPDDSINKYVVACSQIFYSTLLIHLTKGRIETHFHIFGSLAFLAFYRQPKVIYLATILTALDHFTRGAFYPMSIYGETSASYLRAVEHAAWVVFEDIFLLISIHGGAKTLAETAIKENALNQNLLNIEKIVDERTKELRESQKIVFEQQQSLVNSARLSSLGEMAAGIAHEVNNPLAIISNTSRFIRKAIAKNKLDPAMVTECLDDVDKTVDRISKIIVGLRNLSRDSTDEELNLASIPEIFTDVLAICSEKFRNHSIDFQLDLSEFQDRKINCRRIQISQVVLNLLANGHDAIESHEGDKWIKAKVVTLPKTVQIIITDSGLGIPEPVKQKIFNPFYTTKEIGKGTGLGLSLSTSIIERHGGTLRLNDNSPNTQFVITLPL